MRKASVHPGSGLSEECSATTLPHADPHYASERASHTHTCRYADIQTQMQIQNMYMHSATYSQTARNTNI